MQGYWKWMVFLVAFLGIVVFPCRTMKRDPKKGESKDERMKFLQNMVALSKGEMPEITFADKIIFSRPSASTKLEWFTNYKKELDKAIKGKSVALPSLDYVQYEKVMTILHNWIAECIGWAKKASKPRKIIPNPDFKPRREYEPREETIAKRREENKKLQKGLAKWKRENRKDVMDLKDRNPMRDINIPLSRIGIESPPMMLRSGVGMEVIKKCDVEWESVMKQFEKKWEEWKGELDDPKNPLPADKWYSLKEKLEDRYKAWKALKKFLESEGVVGTLVNVDEDMEDSSVSSAQTEDNPDPNVDVKIVD